LIVEQIRLADSIASGPERLGNAGHRHLLICPRNLDTEKSLPHL
jgi:hypothetical protein